MADAPSRSDFSAAADEVTADQRTQSIPEPTRESVRSPETVRSGVAGWSANPDMRSQNLSAIKAIENANRRQQPRQPEPREAKESEKTDGKQTNEQQAYYREMAQELAPKETNPEQQRLQELQKQNEQGR